MIMFFMVVVLVVLDQCLYSWLSRLLLLICFHFMTVVLSCLLYSVVDTDVLACRASLFFTMVSFISHGFCITVFLQSFSFMFLCMICLHGVAGKCFVRFHP